MPRRPPPSSTDARASIAGTFRAFVRVALALATTLGRVFAVAAPSATRRRGVLVVVVVALAVAVTTALSPGLEGLRDPARRDPFEATDAVMRPSEARGSVSHAARLDDRVNAERTSEEPALPGLECDEDDEPVEDFAAVPPAVSSSGTRTSRGRPIVDLGASMRVCAGFFARRDRPPHA
jgi:hypothetical protein